MSERFEAYKGNEPYIFVSYSHKDAAEVYAIIDQLHAEGYRIWYDQGIPQVTRYSRVISEHISGCAIFMVFFTKNSVESQFVLDEVHFARDENKDMLPVNLDGVSLPGEIRLRLTAFQQLIRANHSEYAFQVKLRESLGACKGNAAAPVSAPGMSAEEMNRLGDDYYYGRNGKSQSYIEAVKWFRKAAEQGYAEAQNNLGYCYEYGQGVEKNLAEAVSWYRKAAEQGHAAAQTNLGGCYKQGYGVEQNFTEAVSWYRKAAEQGNAVAQGNLGVCYKIGQGVEQSYTEAVSWYRKAAEQGLAEAQFLLGLCYKQGRGVEQSFTEAAKWFELAAAQGHESAKDALKNLK